MHTHDIAPSIASLLDRHVSSAQPARWWNSPDFMGSEEMPVVLGEWIIDRIVYVDVVETDIECPEADEESELRALIGEDAHHYHNLGNNTDVDSIAAK